MTWTGNLPTFAGGAHSRSRSARINNITTSWSLSPVFSKSYDFLTRSNVVRRHHGRKIELTTGDG